MGRFTGAGGAALKSVRPLHTNVDIFAVYEKVLLFFDLKMIFLKKWIKFFLTNFKTIVTWSRVDCCCARDSLWLHSACCFARKRLFTVTSMERKTREKKQSFFFSLKRNILTQVQLSGVMTPGYRRAASGQYEPEPYAREAKFFLEQVRETRLCRARDGISSAHVVFERPTPAHHLVYRRFWTGTWRWRCTALTRTACSARWAMPVATSASNCWKLVWRGMLAGQVNARRSLSNIKFVFDRFCVFCVSFHRYCDVCWFVRRLPKTRKANVYVIGRLFKNLNLLPTVCNKITI